MLLPETVASVEAQEFDGELDYEIDDRNLHDGRSMLEVCEKYRDARQMALDGGYDALLTVEHDMVLPDGCVQKLWDTPAPVVYAAYMLRHGRPVVNLFRKEGNKNLGMSLSLYPQLFKQAKKQGVIQVSGAGMGCTLFRREAMERAPFRVFEEKPPDLAFASDCVRRGVLQMGRFDVVCGHINDETGEELKLDDETGITARVLALQDVTVNIDGVSVVLKHDRYYSMPVAIAREYVRVGFVMITNEIDTGVELAVAEDFETSDPPIVKRRTPRGKARKVKTLSTKSVTR